MSLFWVEKASKGPIPLELKHLAPKQRFCWSSWKEDQLPLSSLDFAPHFLVTFNCVLLIKSREKIGNLLASRFWNGILLVCELWRFFGIFLFCVVLWFFGIAIKSFGSYFFINCTIKTFKNRQFIYFYEYILKTN